MLALLRLTRIPHYALQTVLIVLASVLFAGPFGFATFALLCAASLLMMAFFFSFNDVEDSADDRRDARKRRRNPVSSGEVSKPVGYALSFSLLAAAFVAFSLVGMQALYISLALAAAMFLYSWKPVRLKAVPFADIVSHGLSFGLVSLISYSSVAAFDARGFFVFAAVMLFEMVGVLANQFKDSRVDRKAGIVNTLVVLGRRNSFTLMKSLLATIVVVGLLAFYLALPVYAFVPIAGAIAFAGALLFGRLRRIRMDDLMISTKKRFFTMPVSNMPLFAQMAYFVVLSVARKGVK